MRTEIYSEAAEKAVGDIRRATRRQYSAEEKVRIVIAGLRGERCRYLVNWQPAVVLIEELSGIQEGDRDALVQNAFERQFRFLEQPRARFLARISIIQVDYQFDKTLQSP